MNHLTLLVHRAPQKVQSWTEETLSRRLKCGIEAWKNLVASASFPQCNRNGQHILEVFFGRPSNGAWSDFLSPVRQNFIRLLIQAG